jgi:hypothetical protein
MSDRRSKWDDSEDTATSKLKLAQDAARRINEKIQPQAPATTNVPQPPIAPTTTTIHEVLPQQQPPHIFLEEIEINDCRNRYTLTKGATLNEVSILTRFTQE